MSTSQQVLLVTLRTLIGWHFLYEGYVKLLRPAWSAAGEPLPSWSAAGYLQSATGPFAGLFQALGAASWIGTLDIAIAISLAAVGLMLMLGLFTQSACVAAGALLTLFYLSAIPTSGLPQPRAEGAYLLVNKTLIELAAVAVVFAFRTGPIAGFDRWRAAAQRGLPASLGEAAA
jgi:thiosulfate dehydrogenase (quinone) large subunit